MKKTYENIVVNVVFLTDDAIRTSANDNVIDMPEFPESFFN